MQRRSSVVLAVLIIINLFRTYSLFVYFCVVLALVLSKDWDREKRFRCILKNSHVVIININIIVIVIVWIIIVVIVIVIKVTTLHFGEEREKEERKSTFYCTVFISNYWIIASVGRIIKECNCSSFEIVFQIYTNGKYDKLFQFIPYTNYKHLSSFCSTEQNFCMIFENKHGNKTCNYIIERGGWRIVECFLSHILAHKAETYIA